MYVMKGEQDYFDPWGYVYILDINHIVKITRNQTLFPRGSSIMS